MKRLLGLALVVCSVVAAQNAALMPVAKQTFLDANGIPLSGGLLYTCVAGASCAPSFAGDPPLTPLATYTDSTASTPNANPIVLDSAGRANVWLGAGSYKLVLQDATGAAVWTQDNVSSTSMKSITATSGNAANFTFTASGTGAVSRTVAAKLGDFISVKDFGAKGDGTTDDTAAIRNAIAATPAGGLLYYPRGTYVVATGTALTITGPIHMYGDGPGSVLQVKTPGVYLTPDLIFKLVAASDVTIQGLSFLGAAVSAGIAGGELYDTAIQADAASARLRVLNCTFSTLNIGVNAVGSQSVTVEGSTMRNIVGSANVSSGYGVLVSNAGNNARVVNNRFLGRDVANVTPTMRHAVYISSGSSNAIVAGNYVEYTLSNALSSNTIGTQSVATHNKYANNTIVNPVQGASVYAAGIGIYGWSTYNEITGNNISGSAANGIALVGQDLDAVHLSAYNTVADNNISNPAYFGITIEGSNHNTVTGNAIAGASTGNSGVYGAIRLSATVGGGGGPIPGAPVGNFISGNKITGSTHNYAIVDNANHAGIQNEIGPNDLTPGTSGTILDGNSALLISMQVGSTTTAIPFNTPLVSTQPIQSGGFSVGSTLDPGSVGTFVKAQNTATLLGLYNSNAGTGAQSRVNLNNGTANFSLRILGSGYTSSGYFTQNHGLLELDSTGSGLDIAASGASAPIAIFANGHTTPDLQVSGGTVYLPNQKALTGTRYLCIDTAGKVISSASACSGT